MTVRVHLLISGRVQGVYYRKNARQEALRLGLTGWVKNLPDRRVEAVIEGEEDRVEEFIQWCRKGPPLAIVRDLKIEHQPATGSIDGFTIRY
ncbi:MAG: acylphosphatase [Candidatus Bathyarchaeota archaeon]|jgi:acylphosphatase